jgi:hypothetical protein
MMVSDAAESSAEGETFEVETILDDRKQKVRTLQNDFAFFNLLLSNQVKQGDHNLISLL